MVHIPESGKPIKKKSLSDLAKGINLLDYVTVPELCDAVVSPIDTAGNIPDPFYIADPKLRALANQQSLGTAIRDITNAEEPADYLQECEKRKAAFREAAIGELTGRGTSAKKGELPPSVQVDTLLLTMQDRYLQYDALKTLSETAREKMVRVKLKDPGATDDEARTAVDSYKSAAVTYLMSLGDGKGTATKAASQSVRETEEMILDELKRAALNAKATRAGGYETGRH